MLIEEVMEEIRAEVKIPKWNGNSEQLTYDAGYSTGVMEGMDMLMEHLNSYAK